MGLRNIVIHLMKELRHVHEAGKYFETETVREAMDELIRLIIKASMEIGLCYSRPKIGMCST